jgi:hypothetical protein
MRWRSLQVRMSIRSWSDRATTTSGIVSSHFVASIAHCDPLTNIAVSIVPRSTRS